MRMGDHFDCGGTSHIQVVQYRSVLKVAADKGSLS